MKVLHLSPSVGADPRQGGVSRFVTALSAVQATLVEKVTVVSATDASGIDQNDSPNGVELVLFPARLRHLSRWANTTITPHLVVRLPELAKESDVIHIHGPRTFQSAIYSILRKCIKSIVVLQPHGSFPFAGGRRVEKSFFDLILGKRLYATTRAWISLTNHEAARISGAGVPSTNIHVIPNGIDSSIRIPRGSKIDFARHFHIEHPDAPWIVFLGRLHETKGLSILLKAFESIRTEVDHAQILIIGPRDDSSPIPDLQTSASHSRDVHLLGSLTESVKFQALSLASVLVTPTFFGFPTTFLEAMLVGTPIVACRGSGLEDELGDVITFADSTGQLADAVVSLLRDSALVSRIRSLSPSYVRHRYDIELIARRHVDLYLSLLEAD